MQLHRYLLVVYLSTLLSALTFNVFASLTPAANFSATTVCQGMPTTFTNNSTTPAGAILANIWDFGDGNGSTASNPLHTYNSFGNFSVTLTVIDSQGDTDSFTALVTVHPRGTTNFQISGLNLCEDTSLSFVNLSSIGVGTISSQHWSFGDGTNSIDLNPSHTYSNHGSYSVTLTTTSDRGCQNSASREVDISPRANVSFSAGLLCNGTSASFTNLTSIARGSVSYSWNFGDGSSSTNALPTHSFATSGNYIVTLEATSDKGCTSLVQNTVTVHPTPLVDFSAADHCFGQVATFQNASSIAVGTFASQWNFGEGVSSTTNTAHTFASTGSKLVRLTLVSDQGCSAGVEKTVMVKPTPNTLFSFNDACVFTGIQFQNESSTSQGNLTYQWDFGDAQTSIEVNPTHSFGIAGRYVVKLTSLSSDGCSSSAVSEVNVFPAPTANFNFTDQCEKSTALFINQSSVASGSVSYSWSFGDGSTSIDINPHHVFENSGGYDVTLTATTEHSCSGTRTKTITIFPQPNVAFAVTDHCEGSLLPVQNQSSITGDNLSYNWTFGNGDVSTSAVPTYTFPGAGNFLVSLTAVSANGCAKTSQKNVDVYATPIPDFSFENKCSGTDVLFLNASTVSQGALTYNWEFADGTMSSQVHPTRKFDNPGSQQVKLTTVSQKGCNAMITKSIVVYPQPVPDFTVLNHCIGTTLSVQNNSSISSGSLSTKWTFGNGAIDNTMVPAYQYPSAGTYEIELTLTSDNGCVQSLGKMVEVWPRPLVNFTVEDVCLGSLSSFINSSTITSGTMSFAWTLGDGSSSTVQHPKHIFNNSMVFNVELVATSDRGCSATLLRPTQVYPTPIASFNVTNHCVGTSAVFQNNSSIDNGDLQFSWNFDNGQFSNLQNPVFVYENAGSYNVVLNVASSFGCSATTSKLIRVIPSPSVDFSAEDGCFGEPILFINNTTDVAGGVSLTWNFGDGQSSQLTNPVHSYATYGPYLVTLSASSIDGACSANITKAINVFQNPVASFSAGNNCLGDLTTFENLTEYFGSDIQYSWNFGNGVTSVDFNPSVQFLAAQTYLVTLTATVGSGCTSTVVNPITIQPNPFSNFIANDVCHQGMTVFSNFSTITEGSLSYEWTFGDGAGSVSNEPLHQYALPGEYQVRLKTISDLGCESVREKSVFVYPLPSVDFAADAVCDGGFTVFKNESKISTGTLVAYLWDFGDATNSISQSPTKQYLNKGTYSVKLTATSDKNCTRNILKDVTVYPTPIAAFSVQDECDGEAVEPVNQSVAEDGQLSFLWSFGDGMASTNFQPSHFYENYGVYSLKLIVTSVNGCMDSITRAVAVYRAPVIDAGLDQTVSKGYGIKLQATGAQQYRWEPIDGLDNSNIADPFARPLQTQQYVLFGTDVYGCVGSDTLTVFVDEDFTLVATNVLTPDGNGSNDTWVIENVETFGDVNVRVFNRWGKLVFRQDAYQNDWQGYSNGDLLPDGTYYYYISFTSSDKIYKGSINIVRNSKP